MNATLYLLFRIERGIHGLAGRELVHHWSLGPQRPLVKAARRGGIRMAAATCTFFGARCRNHDIPVQCRAGQRRQPRDARGGRGGRGLTAHRRPPQTGGLDLDLDREPIVQRCRRRHVGNLRPSRVRYRYAGHVGLDPCHELVCFFLSDLDELVS